MTGKRWHQSWTLVGNYLLLIISTLVVLYIWTKTRNLELTITVSSGILGAIFNLWRRYQTKEPIVRKKADRPKIPIEKVTK